MRSGREGALRRSRSSGNGDGYRVCVEPGDNPIGHVTVAGLKQCGAAQIIKLEISLELNIKLTLTLVFDSGILSPCMCSHLPIRKAVREKPPPLCF